MIYNDFCMLVDILVNFFTAKENKDGSYEHNIKIIAKYYIKGRFIYDLLCTLPTQFFLPFFETSLFFTTMAKLYKILRIFKSNRVINQIKKNELVQGIISRFKLSPAQIRMLMTILI